MRLHNSAPPRGERSLERRTKKVDKKQCRLRLATSRERAMWNMLLANNPDGGTFLQTVQFAELKQKEGWHPRYLVYLLGRDKIAALALTRYIFPLGELWYFPKGPGITNQEDMSRIAEANRCFVLQNRRRVFLIKLEPELPKSPYLFQVARDSGLIPAGVIQAHTSTILLPLKTPPQQLMSSLYRRAQKNIRLGLREAVEVHEVAATEANFRQMYTLMKTVAGGRGVANIRPYKYYRDFWHIFISANVGRLYFAYEDGAPTVGAFVIIQGKKATYKDGGSRPNRRSKAAAYVLQWRIMCDLADQGIKQYDLCGVPPSDRIADTSHRLYGVGFFKTAFSKEVVDYCGVYDQPLRKSHYRLWCRVVYPYLWRRARLRKGWFY